uniref:uncharacterized protein LOC122605431 n=1 Tax=Erigeron canadensis TaxID=72917 RepID=UPI001CB93E8E|nr:uncharacterized protein LOC122605431 [Erigeron canadensis]XP_043634319.1 uncharacterized protein LOC122605431 [Erigeron canadensis]
MPRPNGKPTRSKYGLCDDSYICILSTEPQVDDVPLKECESRSWREFKELDEGNFSDIPGTGLTLNFPLSTKHPFVEVIGNFAVNGFNEAFEKYVERGNHSRLSSPTFRKCTYSKSGDFYEFQMTIWCDEDGFRGIYEAVVACTIDECEKSLWSLVLTGVKQGKVRRASKSKRSEDVGLWLPDIQFTGMCRRQTFYGIIYGGYDYRDPNFINF